MRGSFRKRAFLPLFLFILALSLLSLHLTGRLEAKGVYRLALLLVGPPQRAIHWTVSTARWIFLRYIYLVNLREENERLKEEIRRLRQERDSLIEMRYAVERLRKLLGFKAKVAQEIIPAEVIGQSPSPYMRTIVIGKGRRAGVKRGMPLSLIHI